MLLMASIGFLTVIYCHDFVILVVVNNHIIADILKLWREDKNFGTCGRIRLFLFADLVALKRAVCFCFVFGT